MRNTIKLLFIAILLALLSGCASLTGSRACQCEYNETSGITKWSCESAAMSSAASVSFEPKCGFQAKATDAQPGQNMLTERLIEGMAKAFLSQQIPTQ